MEHTYGYLRHNLLLKADAGEIVDTGHWQALRNVPHTRTVELQNISMEMDITETIESWAAFTMPNLPWAEDHFGERISGLPLNPGEQYKHWPWYRGGVEDHKSTGQFSHSYMERFWPKFAGYEGREELIHYGIRFRFGDLDDVISVLERDPGTRQAYLPIWFPEDITASLEDQRVPCSLGYHFMLRKDQLHCMYTMRSVDFVRYLADDLYMAGRLVQWVISRLQDREEENHPAGFAEHGGFWSGGDAWTKVTPGKLLFMAASLHAFEGDVPKLRREAGHAAV